MRKIAKRVLVVPADFVWDDMGTWDSLDRICPRDTNGNVTTGNSILLNSRDCIVYNDFREDEMIVAAVGVENIAIVLTDDALLVVPKEHSQDVRHVVAELRDLGGKQV